MRSQTFHFAISVVIVSALAAGCGSGDMPEVGEVSGTVRFNEEPIEGVQIMFEPVGGGRSSSAVTDAQGKYTLTYNATTSGAKTGEHVVRLITARGATRDDEGRVIEPGVEEKFPPEYNSSSTQKVTVEAGANTFDFDVTNSK